MFWWFYVFVATFSLNVCLVFGTCSTPKSNFLFMSSLTPTCVPNRPTSRPHHQHNLHFDIFLALNVVTLLLLTAAITGKNFEVMNLDYSVFAQLAHSVNKEKNLSTICISDVSFWFLIRTKLLSLANFFTKSIHTKIRLAFCPESSFLTLQLSIHNRLEGFHY